MDRSAGMILIVIGVLLVVVGALAISGALSWFGRLPGDLRFGSGNTRVFVPITSMIIVSIVLSVVFALFSRR